jgi:SAM-dependent methyltransferase
MPNMEQMDYWNGVGGEHWVAEQARYDEINAEFGAQVVAALAPQPGDRVLDVGCGNGALSLAIAPQVAPSGFALGLDISGPMLEAARQRAHAARLSNAIFEHGDAQTYQLEAAAFDAMVSRFGVMFFDDPDAAFANLARSLRRGGRIVFTCWQDLLANDWLMVPAGAAMAHVPMPDLGEAGQPGCTGSAPPWPTPLDAASSSNFSTAPPTRPSSPTASAPPGRTCPTTSPVSETAGWSPPPPKAAASATTLPIPGSATRYACWPPSICPAPATPRRRRS